VTDTSIITECATILDDAQRTSTSTPQLSATRALSLDDAYLVQAAVLERRLARGERRVGMKMGFTSRAKMVQMGVSEMIWGRLTDAMMLEEGATISLEGFIHPRIEPEVAFLLSERLTGDVSLLQARRAVEAVAPALEIIDSRYQDFKFSLEDVVADNSSSSGVVLGRWQSPDVDLENLGVVMSFDGAPERIGSTAAILGSPWRSLVAAARLTAARGEVLEPGTIVLAGGATAASYLRPDLHVRVEVEALGRVDLRVGAG
jgi:2-oxo-3-hexenedioate decarboxylase